MSKRQYFNEEKYQKTKKKLVILAIIVLIIGILIGGGLIYLGRDYQTDKLQSLRNLEGINQSYLLYQSSNFESIWDKNKVNYYEDDDMNHLVSITVVALDNNSFLEYTKRLNLKYENVLDKAILVNEYRYYSTQLKKERIADRYNYKKGDLINLKYEDENKTQHIKTFELSSVTY